MICDDELAIIEQTKEQILRYSIERNCELAIICCTTAQELLAAPFNYDILLIDIMLDDGMDGITIAKQLRSAGNKAIFCIVTSYKDRAIDGYEATVFRYLVKPLSGKALYQTLDAAIDTLSYDKKLISVKFKYQTNYVHVKDIIYVESYLRKRYIVTQSDRHPTTASWQELLRQFEDYPHFFSPKSTYLVNLVHVTAQSRLLLTMSDGTRIRFAEGKYEQFLVAFADFLDKGGLI
ncbi:MAG: response regulator [Lachnospiraceae bacterium]|nr:response regulator [Lachnospiraceae bacterium]